MGRMIEVPAHSQKIISLVPSQTELLHYLGLSDQIVGITKFCIHPTEKFKETNKIGGTKNFHFARIRALQPSLIIGNKEENYKEGIERLSEQFPVWMSDINTFSDALEMIVKVGEITGKAQKSIELAQEIESKFRKIQRGLMGTAAYVIWKDPIMVAASNTFIDEMLEAAGFKNAFKELRRYPVIAADELKKAEPDFILLSSEPYPFNEKHFKEFQEIVPGKKIVLVDGEIFSWYGSRLLLAPDYFNSLKNQLE